jgi:hypothetical protein
VFWGVESPFLFAAFFGGPCFRFRPMGLDFEKLASGGEKSRRGPRTFIEVLWAKVRFICAV